MVEWMNSKEHHCRNKSYFNNMNCYYDCFFNDFMCPQKDMKRKMGGLMYFKKVKE